MKTLTPSIAIAAASFGLALTASPAFAGPDELPRHEVSVAGIDLNTAEGQRILDRRVEQVAREVCHVDRARIGTRIPSQEARDCLVKARASAQRQVAAIVASQRGG